MKNLIILIGCFLVYSFGHCQIIKDIDEVSPFHEDLAAIKKGDQWGFINKKGEKVIDFRNDLVPTTGEHFFNENKEVSTAYPLFKQGRCLIRKLIDGVYNYGYIDKIGNEVIATQYLNATNFSNGYGIVIKFAKNVVGKNEVLGKQVVSYKLEEYIIDTSGKLVKYLDNARNCNPSKIQNEKPPVFYSKFIAPHMIAVKSNETQKWNIYQF